MEYDQSIMSLGRVIKSKDHSSVVWNQSSSLVSPESGVESLELIWKSQVESKDNKYNNSRSSIMEVSPDEEEPVPPSIWHRVTQPSLFLSKPTGGNQHGRSSNIHSHSANSTGMIPSSSSGVLGVGGDIGTIETDFSDHFVVRRQDTTSSSSDHPLPPPRPPMLPRSDSLESSILLPDLDMIGDQPQKYGMTSTSSSSNIDPSKQNGESQEKIVKSSKKLLTPFQFGKRQKTGITAGISSLIDDIAKESSGLVNRVFPSKLQFDSLIPGRAQPCEPYMTRMTSNLRPFTAIDLDSDSPQGQEDSQGSSFLTDNDSGFDGGEVNSESSSISLTPSPLSQGSTLKVVSTPSPTLGTRVNGSPTTTGHSKEQSSVRRHPFGYCLKESTMNNKSPGKTPPLQNNMLGVNNKVKPNVYRNQNCGQNTPVSSYQGQYTKGQQNPARGDAPSSKIDVQDQRNSPLTLTTASNRVRPKTVCEGQVSYSEKLNMMTSGALVKPVPGTTSIFPGSGRPSVVPQQQQLKEGYAHKLVSAKYFRSDLTSPLSHFYGPIRPFVMTGASSSETLDVQLEWQLQQQQNRQIIQNSIFHTCQQKFAIPIHLVFDCLINLRKVGEGVYGEVFKGYFRGLPDQRVYKIVPIEGSKIVNGEKQKRFEEVEPEIIVAQELNKLRQGMNGSYTDGHSKMIFTRICQGKYPAVLVDQWKSWHRSYVSQNDVPEFEANQLYAVFEFEYHGTDIESYKFKNAKQSTAVLLHVIHALAAAEAACEFEHRDLHWGNILVLKTREPFTTYTIQGTTFRVPNCGLKSTIIDYTISRLTNSSGRPIFTDLANDEDQFCGSEDYQFEIYRMMREENKNDWSTFCPKTNIFWAHYLVEKLIEKGRYLDTTSPTHNIFKNKLYRIQGNLLKFSSCMECARRFLPSICRDLEFEGL